MDFRDIKFVCLFQGHRPMAMGMGSILFKS